jgi:hypothetical protein
MQMLFRPGAKRPQKDMFGGCFAEANFYNRKLSLTEGGVFVQDEFVSHKRKQSYAHAFN